MALYQPGLGISNTATLQASDIGNVPNPQRVRNPDGVPGRMNGTGGVPPPRGLINYTPKPDAGDIEALADFYGVGVRTVERWFGVPDAQGRVQYRNCVPLRSSSVSTVPGALGGRFCSLADETRQRAILATCLCVTGGLYREPIFHKGDRKGNPFLHTELWDTLAECVEAIDAVYTGDANEGALIQQGWVQMNIESSDGGGWVVSVFRFFPYPGEVSDEEECPA